MPRIFCSTYKKYSSGSLKGDWLDLEDYDDHADFMRACRDLHSDEADPEFMFCDHDGIPANFIGECYIEPEFWDYMNSDVDDDVKQAFMALNNEWDEERCNGTYIGEFRNLADLAEYVVEVTGLLDGLSDLASNYFDYDAYGRDMKLGGDVCKHNGHYFWSNY